MKSFDSFWTESHDRITAPQRHEKAKSTAQNANNQAFEKKLRNDLTTGRTDRRPDGKLTGARGPAGRQQICKVRAGNEQNQGNGAKEKCEILSILAHQIFQERSDDGRLAGVGL